MCVWSRRVLFINNSKRKKKRTKRKKKRNNVTNSENQTHCDIIEDFTLEFADKLVELSKQLDFVIFEDRKFADIGASSSSLSLFVIIQIYREKLNRQQAIPSHCNTLRGPTKSLHGPT